MILVGTKNPARACGVSGTTACATGVKNAYGISSMNGNIIGALSEQKTKKCQRVDTAFSVTCVKFCI